MVSLGGHSGLAKDENAPTVLTSSLSFGMIESTDGTQRGTVDVSLWRSSTVSMTPSGTLKRNPIQSIYPFFGLASFPDQVEVLRQPAY